MDDDVQEIVTRAYLKRGFANKLIKSEMLALKREVMGP